MNLFLGLISGKIFTKCCSHFKIYSHLRRKSKHDTFDRVQIIRKEQQHECKCMIQSQNSYFLNKFLADCATYQLAACRKSQRIRIPLHLGIQINRKQTDQIEIL